ncbi:uncharacterized protein LOC135944142 [Cloeon dipterum]|uniref:uncharacterized protein LOC135944142 n=1 Tax=Cloeon dipterum TaxID=197152 RepID=UPI00321FB969
MLSSLFFYLTLFSAVVGQCPIANITDPLAFPYVFRVQVQSDLGYPITFPGFAVNQNYILTSDMAFRKNAALIKITDQFGVVYRTPKSTIIASGRFAILRTCRPLPGPYISMSQFSFNRLSDNLTNAEFILFNENDDVLKKVKPLTVFNEGHCVTITNDLFESVCVDINVTPGFCSYISDAFGDGSTPTFFRAPAVVINGQVNAIYSSSSEIGCNGCSVNDQVGFYSSFLSCIEYLLTEIPGGVGNP